MVAGYLTGKVEAAVPSGVHDIGIEIAELPGREVGEGTHGEWAMVPVERVVVQRFSSKPIRIHSMQHGKVRVYLIKEEFF